jgi:hypothetical protein
VTKWRFPDCSSEEAKDIVDGWTQPGFQALLKILSVKERDFLQALRNPRNNKRDDNFLKGELSIIEDIQNLYTTLDQHLVALEVNRDEK